MNSEEIPQDTLGKQEENKFRYLARQLVLPYTVLRILLARKDRYVAAKYVSH